MPPYFLPLPFNSLSYYSRAEFELAENENPIPPLHSNQCSRVNKKAFLALFTRHFPFFASMQAHFFALSSPSKCGKLRLKSTHHLKKIQSSEHSKVSLKFHLVFQTKRFGFIQLKIWYLEMLVAKCLKMWDRFGNVLSSGTGFFKGHHWLRWSSKWTSSKMILTYT